MHKPARMPLRKAWPAAPSQSDARRERAGVYLVDDAINLLTGHMCDYATRGRGLRAGARIRVLNAVALVSGGKVSSSCLPLPRHACPWPQSSRGPRASLHFLQALVTSQRRSILAPCCWLSLARGPQPAAPQAPGAGATQRGAATACCLLLRHELCHVRSSRPSPAAPSRRWSYSRFRPWARQRPGACATCRTKALLGATL